MSRRRKYTSVINTLTYLGKIKENTTFPFLFKIVNIILHHIYRFKVYLGCQLFSFNLGFFQFCNYRFQASINWSISNLNFFQVQNPVLNLKFFQVQKSFLNLRFFQFQNPAIDFISFEPEIFPGIVLKLILKLGKYQV